MATYLSNGLFIRFTASAFRKLPSIYVFSYFPFGFEGRMWDLIVSNAYHCLSFYFVFIIHVFSLAWWPSARKRLSSCCLIVCCLNCMCCFPVVVWAGLEFIGIGSSSVPFHCS